MGAAALTPAPPAVAGCASPSLARVDCKTWAGGTDQNHVVISCTKYSNTSARGIGDCNLWQPDIATAWITGANRSTSSSHCINGIESTHVES